MFHGPTVSSVSVACHSELLCTRLSVRLSLLGGSGETQDNSIPNPDPYRELLLNIWHGVAWTVPIILWSCYKSMCCSELDKLALT